MIEANNGLFIMDRYWGSEDENSDTAEEIKDASSNLEKDSAGSVSTQENFHSESPECPKFVDSDVAMKTLDIVTSDDHTCARAKKRKRKAQDEGVKDNFILNGAKKDNENLKKELGDKDKNFRTIGQVKETSVEKIKPFLPKWLSNPKIIGIDLQEKEMSVMELPYLDRTSKQNLENAGISFLFPVQLAVVPWLLECEKQSLLLRPSDLCVSAPTGSGKTLAFVLPIVQSLKGKPIKAVRAVIVLPVSELANQVYKVLELFVRGTDLKVALLTGQKSFTAEQKTLVRSGAKIRSQVDIIVTTPGRILDHIGRTKGFSLRGLRYLVIDEADRMMEDIQKGWLKQIEDAVYCDDTPSSCACFSDTYKRMQTPPATPCQFGYLNEPLQKLHFSATLSHDPEKLHMLSLYKPVLFTAQTESEDWIGKCPIPEGLRIHTVVCNATTKPIALCHFLKQRNFKKVLCFTESVERAERLNLVLAELGLFQVREISSNNRPVQRKIILEQFSSGKVDILICSDLVARGIDIEGVDCVISYDVPPFVKTYIHRIGRTARAGKTGTAVTFLTEKEISSFKKMLVSAGISEPEEITIHNEDLESYVESFKNALAVADTKLKQIKTAKRPQNKRAKGKKQQEKLGQSQKMSRISSRFKKDKHSKAF